ncbi:MAG: alkyl sulfatase dimerization domain-containing protein [Pseudomonadota bacterium]
MSTPDDATAFTRELHQKACTDPVFDWANQQDFEFASRGLIHRPDDPAIFDRDGRNVWDHHGYESFLKGDAPDTVHPSLWRHALLNNYRGLFKVTDGVYQVRGESLANVTFVESDRGWIVIDPLTTVETAAYALALVNDHLGERPIVAMCYSHTHSDHFGGVKGMISEEDVTSGRVRVIASEGFVEWVLKEQGLAAEGMPSRNDYMYGENLPVSPTGIVDTGLGQAIEGGEVTYITPTDIIGKDGETLVIDGIELQFMYAPGEAPTGMHCYLPKYRVLHVADNCYMCLHNVYTIRGAFPRDAMQWSDSVARSLQFKDTEILVSGHNWPVFGADEVKTFLGQQRDGIKYMHDQTLRLMSHGYVPAEIANSIRFPPSLDRLWHMRGYYGTLKHNVRGIYAYYLGWYDGNPANLDELPPRDLARRTLDYMGGVESVLDRAEADFDRGEYRWVVHIVNQVIWAEPDNARARMIAARAHTQLGYAAENATWRNAYLSAAQELRNGLPDGGKNHRVLRDVLKGMEPVLLLNSISIRLNGPKAAGHAFVINWTISGSGERCHTELSNAVLLNRDGHLDGAALGMTLPRERLSAFALGECSAESLVGHAERIDGDERLLARIDDLLDAFPAWFPIATHDVKFQEMELLP